MITNSEERQAHPARISSFHSSVPDGTGGSNFSHFGIPRATPATALKNTSESRDLVSRVTTLDSEIRGTHSDALTSELNIRTQEMVKCSPLSMLEQLGEKGFSWRAVAQLVNVTVPALQKWRKGDGISGDNRRRIASLLAGIDMIASQFTVEEIDSWFETPIVDGLPITPITIWSSGSHIELLKYASGELTSDSLLDSYSPSWRTAWETPFVAIRSEDGHISLGMKG